MRFFPSVSVVVLCAASIGVAHAQQAAVSAPVRSTTTRVPSGVNFNYDAVHGQISATGLNLSAGTLKSNSVSPTHGSIVVTLNIHTYADISKNASLHCTVYAAGGIIDLDSATVDGGIETANTFAVRTSGGNSVCRFTIPYSWTLPKINGADTGLIVAFGVAAVNASQEVEHSTLQVDGVENLPGSGATSEFTFNVEI